LENDEIVLNKERREKFKRWFLGALLPVRSDHGIIRVVGTILHMDSLLESLMPEHQLAGIRRHHLLKRDSLKEYSEIKLPWLSIKYKAHTPGYEHLLWPEKKSAEWLQDERKKYIAQGLPEVYSQEYLNIPIDESFALFRKSDFLPIREEDIRKNVNCYITVDLAISEKTRSDYSVFTVGALDYDGCLQIRNIIRDRLDAREIVDLLIHLQRQYKPVAVGVEEGMIQKSILPFLREQMIVTGQYLSLFPLKPSIDKVTRCRSIQARMRAGGVRFAKDAEWFADLESECLRFPRDKHDDQVDTLSYLGLMLDKLQEASTPQELEKESIENELQEAGFTSHGKDGRNETTGY
jgi:predicted phage terminase large subunit-like protein